MTLRVRCPPADWLADYPSARYCGIPTSNVANGAYLEVYGSHVLAYQHDDGTGRYVGVDPTTREAAIAGRTVVWVSVPAGNQSRATLATLSAAALVAVLGAGTVTADGENLVFPVSSQTGFSTGGHWDSRSDAGLLTAYGEERVQGGNSIPSSGTGFQQFDPTELDAALPDAFTIVGIEWHRGNDVDGPQVTGLFSAAPGATDGDALAIDQAHGQGARSTVTPGGEVRVLFTPSECLHVAAAGPARRKVWAGFQGDGGDSSIMSRSGGGRPAQFFTDGSGDSLFVTNDASGSGVPIPVPSGVSTIDATFAITCDIRLLIHRGPNYSSQGHSRSFLFTEPGRNDADFASQTSAQGLIVHWQPHLPPTNGWGVLGARALYNTHGADPEDNFRLECWDTSNNVLASFGRTSGIDTGWVPFDVSGGSVDLSAGGPFRFTVKRGTVAGASTALAVANGTTGSPALPENSIATEMYPPIDGTPLNDTEVEYVGHSEATALAATTSPFDDEGIAPVFPANTPGVSIEVGESDGFTLTLIPDVTLDGPAQATSSTTDVRSLLNLDTGSASSTTADVSVVTSTTGVDAPAVATSSTLDLTVLVDVAIFSGHVSTTSTGRPLGSGTPAKANRPWWVNATDEGQALLERVVYPAIEDQRGEVEVAEAPADLSAVVSVGLEVYDEPSGTWEALSGSGSVHTEDGPDSLGTSRTWHVLRFAPAIGALAGLGPGTYRRRWVLGLAGGGDQRVPSQAWGVIVLQG